MSRRNAAAEALIALWFRHEVVLHTQGGRTALGPVRGEEQTLLASVDMEARTVTAPSGEEVVASGTVCWKPEGPLPKAGDRIILPEVFGRPRGVEVIASKRAGSGNGLTPDHVRVMVK